jgi:membrane-associated phospholipid phosphatase
MVPEPSRAAPDGRAGARTLMGMVSPMPSGRVRGPRAAGARGIAAELVLGTGLLAVAGLGGLFFTRRPWPNRLDTTGYRLLPADHGARWAHDLTHIGSLTGVLIGVAILVVVALTQDWVRAVVCAVAPLAAVLVVEQVAKPLIGRQISGVIGSYPSGTVTAVSALAAAAVLVTPRAFRAVTTIAAAALVVGICAAVVILRWHYPTDALGGACVGIGAVLFLDGLAHLPWVMSEGMGSLRAPHPREPRSAEPRSAVQPSASVLHRARYEG